MKKSLIALAAVAASGAAFAQSSVTLYGVIDTAVTHVKGEDSVTGLTKSGTSSSRIGFRGVEDLGNGLKAEFVLEGDVDSDNGGSAFNFARQSTVGVSGNFGTLRLGRELTASYNAVSRYDQFGTNGVGATLAWSTTETGYEPRASNMITYYTPKFSGFGVGVNYGFGEQSENRVARYVGVGATYDNGPLSLGLGYDKQNNELSVTGTEDQKSWALGGSYDFGVAKLAAFYKDTKYVDLVGDNDYKLKSWNIGLSAPVGAAGEAKIAYNNYKVEDAKAQQLSLGYVHKLSKRTAVYGTYAYIKNKNGMSFELNNRLNAANLTSGGKQQAVQVGIRHAF